METIKNVLGYGSQSGQEPASAEAGKGTVEQPYDGGNAPGQSGAPATDHTSTNPTGTSQYDTADSTSESGTKQSSAEVASEDSKESQPAGSTAAAAEKGTDETRGPDEAVTDRPTGAAADENTTAQDTFFSNAEISKDKPPAEPKILEGSSETTSSPAAAPPSSSSTAQEDTSSTPPPPPTSSTTTDIPDPSTSASTAPEKNYKTANTEPHPQSSEVLSSATPGAALPDTRNTDSGPDSQFEEPSPKSQPVGDAKLDKVGSDEAGLSGVSHDENPPSAPDTGVPGATEDAKADIGAGEGSGSGKKKMGERIKEKLHIGRSKDKS